MSKLDFHLASTSQDLKQFHEDLDVSSITWNESLLVVQPKFNKATQKNALKLVLLNIAKYGDREILYSRRNEKLPPEEHNPHRISNKSILNVVDALSANGLLHKTTGDKYYMTVPEERQTSTFRAKEQLVSIARSCFPEQTITELPKSYIIFKDENKKFIEYEHNNYTLRIEQVMKFINEHTNKQDITLFGESLLPVFYQRQYLDYHNIRQTYPFVFNGRCYPRHVFIRKDKRPEIKINGEPVVSLDYSSSVPSIVYEVMTGTKRADVALSKTPYEVHEGIPRAVAKRTLTSLLNAQMSNIRAGITGHFTNPKADQEEKEAWKKCQEYFNTDNPVDYAIKYVVEHNKAISQSFLQGAQHGQHWAWIEANYVYETAFFLMKELDVPMLIVHDEFLVPESRAEGLEDYMYTVGLDEFYYKTNYTGTIFTQEPVDFERFLQDLEV